jgi:hypothetical protein
MSEKSILEQALLQINTLEEAVKQNAKGILASTMKQELSDLLKESQEEEDETVTPMEEQPTPDEEEKDDIAADDETADDETADDESDDETSDDDTDAENDDTNLDNEPIKGIDSLDADSDVEDTDTDDMSDMGTDTDDMGADDDVMDMTGASDDEVMKVFKAMKPEDGIVVKKDGNNIDFSDGNDEYIIKLDDESAEEETFEPTPEDSEMDTDMGSETGSEEDEESVVYEIDLGETDESEEEEEGEVKEVEATEAARTFANDVRKPANQGKKFKAGRKEMNEEVETLKKQNGEYKKALILFKEKLNEVAIFNANLAYFTRLVTESSTTKQEKLNILKRFDSVSTMSESKNLFNTIKAELETKKPVTESVVNKISNTPTTSSSTEVLAESKAYENPQFKRMKDLMSKIK